jgi:hypothetical protein
MIKWNARPISKQMACPRCEFPRSLFIWLNEKCGIDCSGDELRRLKYLFLHNKNLTSIPPEIRKLKNLEELYLCNNKLTSLPPEIGQLTYLHGLYLDNNNLTSLPIEIGQLKNLRELDLCNNHLTYLPPEIGGLELKYYRFDGDMQKQYESYLSQSKFTIIKFRDIVKKYDTCCPICHDDFKKNTKVKMLWCKHYFCKECITHWFKKKDTCPICVQKFRYVT